MGNIINTYNSFPAVILPPSYTVVRRINAAGPLLVATDGGPNWLADNASSGASTGVNFTVSDGVVYDTGWVPWTKGATIPASLPTADHDTLFDSERYIEGGATNIIYTITSLSNGTYKVRIYTGDETASGNDEFSINVQSSGNFLTKPWQLFGHRITGVVEFDNIEVSDGSLVIDFNNKNPYAWLMAIELLKLDE